MLLLNLTDQLRKSDLSGPAISTGRQGTDLSREVVLVLDTEDPRFGGANEKPLLKPSGKATGTRAGRSSKWLGLLEDPMKMDDIGGTRILGNLYFWRPNVK